MLLMSDSDPGTISIQDSEMKWWLVETYIH